MQPLTKDATAIILIPLNQWLFTRSTQIINDCMSEFDLRIATYINTRCFSIYIDPEVIPDRPLRKHASIIKNII